VKGGQGTSPSKGGTAGQTERGRHFKAKKKKILKGGGGRGAQDGGKRGKLEKELNLNGKKQVGTK